jgi:hypothetical protein
LLKIIFTYRNITDFDVITRTQDSARLGALIKGKGSKAEEHLMNIVYRDLALLHDVEADELRAQTIDYFGLYKFWGVVGFK